MKHFDHRYQTNENKIIQNMRLPGMIKTFLLGLVALFISFSPIHGQSMDTISSGSIIIDMGVTPQTFGNAIKPYGLIYELARFEQVPVKWIIRPGKGKDEFDFVHDGQAFFGGPFIVPEEFLNSDVNDRIANYESMGVQTVTMVNDQVLPVALTIDYYPVWTLDQENGSIAEEYLENANLPMDAYNWKLPSELDCCNDVYVMPHADPEWETHENLYFWNDADSNGGCRGSIWGACHAVSALENMFNPAMPSQQTNFLSDITVQADPEDEPYADNALILWGDHDDGTLPPPYQYENHDDQVMQFMGTLDNATTNGSEQIYLPHISWRGPTQVTVYDSDNPEVPSPSPGPAALVAYGYAFGDSTRGRVMYEAGHSHNKGSDPYYVAAQRAFFNFSWWASALNKISNNLDGPDVVIGGMGNEFEAIATGGAGSYSYEWSASCAGSFNTTSGSSVIFTPDQVMGPTDCVISVVVQDFCGTRTSFTSQKTTIVPNEAPPMAQNDSIFTLPCQSVTFNVLDNDQDPNLDPLTVSLLGNPVTENGTFSNQGGGDISYTPNFGFEGVDSISYEVCDPTPECDTATIYVEVGNPNPDPPIPGTDDTTIVEDLLLKLAVLDNDTDPNMLQLSVDAVVNQAEHGHAYLGMGNIINYLPDQDFEGVDTFTYRVCNSNGLCAEGTAIITVIDDGCPSGEVQASDLQQDTVVDHFFLTRYSTNAASATSCWDSTWVEVNDDNDWTAGDITIRDADEELEFKIGSSAPRPIIYRDLDLTDATSVTLSFDASDEDFDSADDSMAIEISTDLINYTRIVKFEGANPLSSNPQSFNFDLSSIAGPFTGIARIRFIGLGGNNKRIRFDNFNISFTRDGSGLNIRDNFAQLDLYNQNYGSACWDGPWVESADGGDPEGGDLRIELRSGEPVLRFKENNGLFIYRDIDLSGGSSAVLSYLIYENTLTAGEEVLIQASNDGGSSYTTLTTHNSSSTTGTYTHNLSTALGTLSANTRIRIYAQAGDPDALYFDDFQISFNSVDCEPIGNRAPIAVDDYQEANCNETILIDVQANDFDQEDNIFFTAGIDQSDTADNGTVTIINNSSIEYEPNQDFVGRDTFAYYIVQLVPGNITADTASVVVDIANCPPEARDTMFSTAFETMDTFSLEGAASDVNSDTLVTSLDESQPPSNGLVEQIGVDSFKYTPFPGFTGIDTFGYVVCDGVEASCVSDEILCDTAFVYMTVVNRTPVASDDTAVTIQCQDVSIPVVENDTDPEMQTILVFEVVDTPAAGMTSIDFNQLSITYTPPTPPMAPFDTPPDTVTFSYRVCDDGTPMMCDTAQVTVIIDIMPNSPPMALSDIDSTIQGQVVFTNVLDNDSDPEGLPLEVSVGGGLQDPMRGTVSVLPNQRIAYQPTDSNFIGFDTFEYQVCDNPPPVPAGCPSLDTLCDTSFVSIQIKNQPPVAIMDTYTLEFNASSTLDILDNDVEPDSDTMEITGVGTDASDGMTFVGGSVSINDNGTPGDFTDDYVDYTPPMGFTGIDSFYYSNCDRVIPLTERLCDSTLVILDVSLFPAPDIAVAKEVTNIVPAANMVEGQFDVSYHIVFQNTGVVSIDSISLKDNFAQQFSSAFIGVVSAPVVTNIDASIPPTANGSFDGTSTDPNLIIASPMDSLAPGESFELTVVVRVDAFAEDTVLLNVVTAEANGPDDQRSSDLSDNGIDPTTNNGVGGFDDPTPLQLPYLLVSKQVSQTNPPVAATSGVAGNFDVTYEYKILNAGNVSLDSITVTDDLSTAFGPALVGIVSGPSITNIDATNPPLADTSYTGAVSSDSMTIASSTDTLDPGQSFEIDLVVEINPFLANDTLFNQAIAYAYSPDDTLVVDSSDNGSDPATDNGSGGFNDPTPLNLAVIGLAKRITNYEILPNGTYRVSYQFRVQNNGNDTLININLTEDFSSQFGAAFNDDVMDLQIIDSNVVALGGELPDTAMAYSGSDPTDNLLAGNGKLPPQAIFFVNISVIVDPYDPSATETIINQGEVTAETIPGTSVSDLSDDGIDPKGDNGEGGYDDPTEHSFPPLNPTIGISKVIKDSIVSGNGDGSYTMTYALTVENLGDVILDNIRVTDDLTQTFAGADTFTVNNVYSPDFLVNPSYNGDGAINVLSGADSLGIGRTGDVEITITVTPGDSLGPYYNTALAYGLSPDGVTVTDTSDAGDDPDPNMNGIANEAGENDPTPVTFVASPSIGVAKAITSGPVNNGDGTYSLTYEVKIENTGDIKLDSILLNEDLSNTFMGAVGFTLDSYSSTDFTVNGAFDGASDTELLSGSDSLDIGQMGIVQFTVTVEPGGNLGPYDNSASGSGMAPNDSTVTDISQEGTNVDPDGDGDPTNNNDPTPVTFDEGPEIGVAKTIIGSPVSDGDTLYTLTYLVLVENTGDVPLSNLQITDDLSSTFAAANNFTIDSVGSNDLSTNPAYDGNGDINLLDGSDDILVGETDSVVIVLTVEPGSYLGPYENTATGNGDSPAGTNVFDDSQNGTDVDPDNDGDPTNNNEPTPVTFLRSPEIICPSDTTLNTDAGVCYYKVNGNTFDPQVIIYNDGDSMVTHDYLPAPSDTTLNQTEFPVGTTIITWTITDANGNTDTCSFTVTVEDNETPSFVNCPTDTITVGNDFANCSGGVNWSQPVAEDNCGVDSVERIAGPAPGQILAVGNYNISYIAYDGAMNTDTCSFVVSVQDVQQPFISCPQDLTIGTDAGVCEWASTPGSLSPSLAIENCEPSVTYEVTNPDGSVMADSGDVSGYVFELGQSTVEYTLTDSSGTQIDSCSYTVTVVDDEAPVITCPADQTFSTSAGSCDASVNLTAPGFSDNCSSGADSIYYRVTNPDNTVSGPFGASMPYTFELGNSQVEWTVVDTAGNTDECIQNITVEDNEFPMIICLADSTVNTDTGECSYRVSGGEFDPILVSDNCPNFSISHNVEFAPNSNTLDGADFPTGTTIVNWTVADASGNSSFCIMMITVEDNETPSFVNCPTDTITVGNDFANCSGGVNWSQPIAEDNCAVDSIVQISGPAPGQILSVGSYDITYVAYDPALNTDTCTFVVSVEDVQQPFIGCPQDITIGTDDGVCEWASTAGSLTPSLAIENCEPELTYEVTNPDGSVSADSGDLSGYVFALGTSTVQYTLTDSSGMQIDSCSFNVTVEDDENPVIIRCDSFGLFSGGNPIPTLFTDPGVCTRSLTFFSAIVVDNCTSSLDVSVILNNPDGSIRVYELNDNGSSIYTDTIILDKGITEYKVVATDSSGNTGNCIGTIEIIDPEPPSAICPADTTIRTSDTSDDEYCGVTASISIPMMVDDNCEVESYTYQITNPDGSLEGPFDLINYRDSTEITLNLDVGESTVTYSIKDATGNVFQCFQEIMVIDDELPSFVNCPTDTITVGNDFSNCSGGVNWSQPIAEDNCEVDSVIQVSGPAPGQILPVGTYDITYVTYDPALNTDTCSFVVSVEDVQQPFIGCPQDITIGTDNGVCEWASTVGSLTPSLAIENCEPSLTYEVTNPDGSVDADSGDVSGYVFVLGQSTVEYTLTDSSGTQIDSCSFTVRVIDDEAPVISCPADQTLSTAMGSCDLSVSLTAPGFSDNCSGAADSIYYTVTNPDNTVSGPFGSSMPYTFKLGNSQLEWTVVDTAGNTNQCTQNIRVEESELPVITCPPDTVIVTSSGNAYDCKGQLDWTHPVPSDNCGLASYTVRYTNPDGEVLGPYSLLHPDSLEGSKLFELGTSLVTYYVADQSGNEVECSFEVTVEDDESPIFLNCPRPEIVENAEFNECSAYVNFSLPIPEDNCSGGLTMMQVDTTGLTTGDRFPVGSTILKWVAMDQSGNLSDTCSITIIVNDRQSPYIVCPSDTSGIPVDPGSCGAVVNDIGLDSLFDNCPDNTIVVYSIRGQDDPDSIINAGFADASGNYFEAGTSEVTYCVMGQPLIMITEVTQSAANSVDGANTNLPSYVTGPPDADYLEVTNFGPNALDISNLGIEKLPGSAAGDGSVIIPEGIVMQPGDIMIIHMGTGMDDPSNLYFNMDAGNAESGAATGYTLNYAGNVLDAVALNGFDPENLGNLAVVQSEDWSGNTSSTFNTAGVKRTFVFDTNHASDFTVVSNADPGSIGYYNSTYPAPVDNGGEVSLQNTDLTPSCCSFEVEVVDNEAASINCPIDVVVPTSSGTLGDCMGEYTWTHPSPMDNCNPDSFTVSFLNPDGSVDGPFSVNPDSVITRSFDKGETVVQYYVEDPSGNVTGCEFSVTVEDNEPPTIACPGDMTVNLDPGQCRAAMSFLLDFISDNCGIDTIISTPSTGSFFEIGVTDVNFIVIDEGGLSDTCSFEITVKEFIPTNNTFACNDFIQISLDENCEALITADMVLEGNNYGCLEDYPLTITDLNGNPVDALLGLDDVGDTLIVTIIDPSNGNRCTTHIYIEDKLVPEVVCPPDTTINCNVSTDPDHTGRPQLLSCEGSVVMDYNDEITPYAQCEDTLIQITRTWTITDESNNSVSCTQVIHIRGFSFDQLIWPEQFDGTDNPALSCEAVDSDPSLLHPSNTGYPMLGNDPIFGNHHCEIFVGYEDRVLQDANCPAGYEIFRSWLVRDMCEPLIEDENPREFIQVIRVQDQTPPVFTACPDELIVSTDPNSCGTMVNIDDLLPEISDACSGIMNIDLVVPPYVIGNFFEAGRHTVEIVAMDSCYNTSRCRTIITVEDEVPPIPVCDQTTTISLTNYPDDDPDDGIARVGWETFEDGSYDNCEIDRIQVRRLRRGACNASISGNDRVWKDFEEFCCADIPDNPIMIEMGVWDKAGNFNSCMVEVFVEDKIRPSIVPPADLTLSCTYPVNLLDLDDPADTTFGKIADHSKGGQRESREIFDRAFELGCNGTNGSTYDANPFPSYNLEDGYADDNCNVDSIEIRIIDQRNNCGVGNVIREFIVRDDYGQQTPENPNNPFTKITQVITFVDCDAFTEDDIIWPRHYDGSPGNPILTCEDIVNDSTSADPTPQGTGVPTFRDEECATPAIRYEDEIFDVVPDACYKIFRHWEVLDWCQYDDSSNPPEGYWEYTQVIKIKDTDDPVFTNCNDVSICDSTATNCFGLVEIEQQVMDCTPDEFLEAHYVIDLYGGDNDPADDIMRDVNDGIVVEDGAIKVSESLPFGTHSITYFVEDRCGNVGSCTHLISVSDCKIPTPYCLNGIATVVMPAIGEIEVWASDLDAGSFDNCGALQFSFSSNVSDSGRIYTCDDLENGASDTFEVQVWVTDEAGNQDYCETYLIIQDPNDVCPDTGQIVISGQTLTSDNKGVENAEIRLENDNAPTPLVKMTDGNGGYNFYALAGEDYKISASKNDDPLNGVSTWDIALIQMHILGLRELEDPYLQIAANINDDEKISGADIIDLRKVILGIEPNFPENESWRFVDAQMTLPDNVLPRGYAEVIDLNNVMTNQPDRDFVAVKIGDLDGSVVPNGFESEQLVQRTTPLVLSVEDQVAAKGEEIHMEVTAEQFNNVMGYQLTFEYHKNRLSYSSIEPGKLDLDGSNIGVFAESGQLTMSWNESAPQSVSDGEVLFTLVFRAIEDSRLSETVEISSKITSKEAYVNGQVRDVALRFTDAPLEFALYQNVPNPFYDQTVIGFNLPYDAKAKILIYDASGKIVKNISGNYEQGNNQVSVDQIDMRGSGVYYYELICEHFKATKKMILTGQ